jgi:hypothetical protein
MLLAAAPAASYQIPTFTDATAEVGIDDLYSAPGVYGPGIAVVDIDDDGDLDVFIPNDLTGHKFYRNDGTGNFTDIAAEVGLQFVAELPPVEDQVHPLERDPTSMMPTFVDTDGDGDKDFFITGYNTYCRFFENVSEVVEGELQIQFVDRTVESGLNIVGHSATAAWGDFDRNGRPDVYIADWGGMDHLFRSDGDNRWSDRSLQTRIHDELVGNATPGPGWSAIWWDHNRDGWPDLYVGNDYGLPNYMYMAATDGTFVDQKYSLFPELNEPGGNASYNATMGQALCDYDHDGDYDLFVANSLENNLYRNDGGVFTDLLAILGNLADGMPLADLDNHDIGWFCDWPDVDLDGEEDLFLVNGYILICVYDDPFGPPDCGGEGKQEQNNQLWMNTGDGGFDQVTGVAGLRDLRWGKSGAFADFDLDGDLDLFVTNSAGVQEPGTHAFWRNDTITDNHWLRVKLVGAEGRGGPFGAEVEVTAGDRTWRRLRTASQGYLSFSSPELHFGVGQNERVDSVVVRWPNGDVDTVENVRTNRRMTIVQNEGLRVPALVAPLLRGAESRDGIRLTWDAPAAGSGADRFLLQRTAEGGIGGTLATIHVEAGRQTYEYVDRQVEAGRRYTYRLTVASGDLSVQGDAVNVLVNPMARRVEVAPAAPNPFNPRTTLTWRVAPDVETVRLRLFDTRGRLVREFDPPATAGWNSIVWDGTDRGGAQVASGTYRFVVEADGQMESVSLTLVR